MLRQVLADSSTKLEIEEEVSNLAESYKEEGGLLGTKVVVRTGNPCLSTDLLKVSVEAARAIIVLSVGARGCAVAVARR